MPELRTKTLSTVARLAGAIIAETNGEYYLVGELKEPCDFAQRGFAAPAESGSNQPVPYRKLNVVGDVALEEGDFLEMETQGEPLAQLLFKRFVILRNHSVSDRLWRVVTCRKDQNGKTDARWLEHMPDEVWEIVRENVLKCR